MNNAHSAVIREHLTLTSDEAANEVVEIDDTGVGCGASSKVQSPILTCSTIDVRLATRSVSKAQVPNTTQVAQQPHSGGQRVS